MRKLFAAAALALSSAPVSASAQGASVSAGDPAGIVRALEAAGYSARLEADEQGDPMIVTELAGWGSRLYFYGCDAQSHGGCDAIQFSTGFDRKIPWTAAQALTLSARFRFAAVRLDDEGDPYIMWDLVTGDGLPTKVFLTCVQYYSDTVEVAAEAVFEGDAADTGSAAPTAAVQADVGVS